jgi:hypothetical protein
MSRYVLIAALVLAGEGTAAQSEAKSLLAKAPQLNVGAIQQSAPFFQEPNTVEKFRKAWSEAGIPDRRAS